MCQKYVNYGPHVRFFFHSEQYRETRLNNGLKCDNSTLFKK